MKRWMLAAAPGGAVIVPSAALGKDGVAGRIGGLLFQYQGSDYLGELQLAVPFIDGCVAADLSHLDVAVFMFDR